LLRHRLNEQLIGDDEELRLMLDRAAERERNARRSRQQMAAGQRRGRGDS
jgi:hypothetical protein